MNTCMKSTLAVAITGALVACGGGGSDSSPSTNNPAIPPTTEHTIPEAPTVPNQQSISATLFGSDILTWEQGKATEVQLLDQDNNAVEAVKCVSDDNVRLTVALDCSAMTVHRLGQSSLSVTGANNLTTKLIVNGVPTKSPLAVNSGGNNDANRIVTAGGEVLTWGTNYRNQLSTIDTNTVEYLQYPKPVVTNASGNKLNNIYQVAHSKSSTYALNNKGRVFGWGPDLYKSTVSGSSEVVFAEPVQDATGRNPLTNIVRLASASLGNQVMGLTDDGRVMRWGSSDANNPQFEVDNNGEPLKDIISIALEFETAYAINKQGRVYQWDLDPNASIHPVSLVKDKSGTPITGITKIVTGPNHTLALTDSGNIYAWGNNNQYQLGDPALEENNTVIGYANYVKLGSTSLNNIKDIAINFYSSYALTQSGNVYAWGFNGTGELGDGINKPAGYQSGIPKLVVSESGQGKLSNVVAITGMEDGALALKSNGNIVGWGGNWHGLLTQNNPEGGSEYPYPVLIQKSEGKALSIGDINQFTKLK